MRWKGVNLGNWLVLEKWMHPDLFAGTDAEDETWLGRHILAHHESGKQVRERIRRHRETYVTEEDFRRIAAAEMNLVRIPVPYHVFGPDTPEPRGAAALHGRGVPGCVSYLDRAFDWAEKYGLKILLDLHTTPGGQNGYDNGGIVGVCRWHLDPESVEYCLRVLERLAERYGKRPGLMGIEVVNEPISHMVWRFAASTRMAADPEEAKGSGFVPTAFLKRYYEDAYLRLRAILPEDRTIVFHDGFRFGPWRRFFREQGMKNVMLDIHPYIWAMEMYIPVHRPFVYRIYLDIVRRRIRALRKEIPVLVGEWCICSHWAHDLPGWRGMRRVDRLYELAGNPGVVPEAMKKRMRAASGKAGDAARTADYRRRMAAERQRRFRIVAKMELGAWREAAGWCYWSWKLDPQGIYQGQEFWKAGWDLSCCLKKGWVPPHIGRF